MRKTGGQNFSLFLSKKSGKKIMKKNQQTSLLFFHIKNNKNTSDRIEKPCLLYKRKKKLAPILYYTL